jgi:hypothetical protein
VPERTKVIQEVHGKKKCGIINISTKILQFYGNVLIITEVQ